MDATLEGMNKYDLGGGMHVSYGPSSHTRLSFVELSIISDDGRFRR